MSTLRHLSRLRHAWALTARTFKNQQRWTQTEGSGSGGIRPFNKKEYDIQQYGGFKSVDKLFAKPERQGVVGRWDWHFWHFLLALIPPGVVVLLAQLARNDMAAKQLERNRKATEETLQMLEAAQKLKDARAAAAAGQMQQQGGALQRGQPRDETQEMRQRLAELEATVKALAAMQPQPQAATALGAGPERAQGSGENSVKGSNASPSGASAHVTFSSEAPASKSTSPLAAAPSPSAGHGPASPPPLPKLPDNPLDRWLPETDCQFCNDTRQRLWGAFKSTTGYKSAYDKGHAKIEAAAAVKEGPSAEPGGAATSAEVPAGPAAEPQRALASPEQQPGKGSDEQPEQLQQQGSSAEPEQSLLAAGEQPPAAPTVEAGSQQRRSDGAPAAGAPEATERVDEGPEAREPTAPRESSPGPVSEAAPDWESAQAPAPATAALQTRDDAGSGGLACNSTPPPAAAAAAAAPGVGAAAAGAKVTPAGKTAPLPKLPDNPLDRWLPETDCQFCNDTRQQLWGAFKAAAGMKAAPGKGQQSGSQGTTEETNTSRLP